MISQTYVLLLQLWLEGGTFFEGCTFRQFVLIMHCIGIPSEHISLPPKKGEERDAITQLLVTILNAGHSAHDNCDILYDGNVILDPGAFYIVGLGKGSCVAIEVRE